MNTNKLGATQMSLFGDEMRAKFAPLRQAVKNAPEWKKPQSNVASVQTTPRTIRKDHVREAEEKRGEWDL